eukprot:10558886-Ditylum_brightwellii.AAC.1
MEIWKWNGGMFVWVAQLEMPLNTLVLRLYPGGQCLSAVLPYWLKKIPPLYGRLKTGPAANFETVAALASATYQKDSGRRAELIQLQAMQTR